jgi:peptide-methionine (S)-S-oxide reductase
MSTPPPPSRKELPDRPSEENLKKQAKALAKRQKVQLSAAHYALAKEYGFASWPKMMEHVRQLAETTPATSREEMSSELLEAIASAARTAELASLKQLLGSDPIPDMRDGERDPLLSLVCKSDADVETRLETAKWLIDRGARPRAFASDGTTALHWAAWRGPMAMVELVIRAGAREWQEDQQKRKPVDYAREGVAADKSLIVEALDRPVIRDPAFRAAVAAIQIGDLDSLKHLLQAHPNLVHDRAIEPDFYSQDYFRDPKLLWFVANNPNLIETMPANTIQIAEAIIDAGAEQSDMQYTLGLVMTCTRAREQGFQRPLIHLLLARGAEINDTSFIGSLGHGERDAVIAVLETGVPVSVTAAAGLGRLDDLARLLSTATDDEKHAAMSLAVINRQLEAARMCIEAGAEINRVSVVHQNSMPIHQATVNGDVPMMKLLVKHGARLDIADTMWNGTPLGWAIHTHQPEAEAYLRSLGEP